MAKRTPLACTLDNCGENFEHCGRVKTYSYGKCRCDSCHAAKMIESRKYAKPKPAPTGRGPCSPDNCGRNYSVCGTVSTYSNRSCRCDACIAAESARTRARRLADPDAHEKYQREYYTKNRDKSVARSRARYQAKKEEHNAAVRQWQKDNPEKFREYMRRSRERRKDANAAYNRQYRQENKAAERERLREYRAKFPEIYRDAAKRRRALRVNATVVKFTHEQWLQKCAYWGNKCYLQIPEFCTGGIETMDHVKPLTTGSTSAHMLANLRPACAPCNSSKKNKWPYAVPTGPVLSR